MKEQVGIRIAYTGVGLEIVGWLLSAFFPIEAIRRSAPLLISFGLVSVFFGIYRAGTAKGYGWPVAFLGLLNLIGVVIVKFLPRKEKE